jgi:hypothetical protein
MRAHAADRVFLDCRGAGILVRHARCTGRALLTVKLVSVHSAGREREPSQDALMPPRLEDGLRDERVPGDPGRSGLRDGSQPGLIADLDADRRPGPRNVAAGLAGAVQAGGPQEGATARHVPALSAVTLVHAEGHGEPAHCRRYARGHRTVIRRSQPRRVLSVLGGPIPVRCHPVRSPVWSRQAGVPRSDWVKERQVPRWHRADEVT